MAAATVAGGSAAGALALLLRGRGWEFYPTTGHLMIRLGGVNLGAAAMAELLPELAALASEELAMRRLAVRKARIDLSATALTDEGLRAFLASWGELGLGKCSVCFMLQRNRLTDDALTAIGDFAISAATGAVEELHASHQLGPSPLSRSGVLALLRRLARCPKYPIWAKRARSFRPAHVRLNNCGVEAPADIAGELEAATGARVCFADDHGCVRTACRFAREGGLGCPVAHLYDFRSQELPASLPEPVAASALLEVPRPPAEAGGPARRGRTFLCGACNRELPIDMFTRSQFQKAAKMDQDGEEDRAHLVRRCFDCVRQPCCACGEELPLSAFAGTQMLRAHGSRRCRTCAAETWLCARCRRPKAKRDFSAVEAKKMKKLAKICIGCEGSNPYFERRYIVCMAFSGRYAQPPTRLPALAREVLARILDFAREARFVTVSRTGFRCLLCARSWSFLSCGDEARDSCDGGGLGGADDGKTVAERLLAGERSSELRTVSALISANLPRSRPRSARIGQLREPVNNFGARPDRGT